MATALGRKGRWALLLWLLHGSVPPARAADADSLAWAVKAAFLDKFQYYVTWPDSAFAAPTSPFALCIVGQDPFGALIDRAVSGQRVGQHPIAVRRLAQITPDDHCQMLYLATDDPQWAARQLAQANGQNMLSVADLGSAGLGSAGGANAMINFVIADERVRFTIDEAAVARGGLMVSSKLLGVALSVRAAP